MNIDFIILAAGKGTRMGGNSPKVLASLAGRPMIQHLVDRVDSFPKSKISVIVGFAYFGLISGPAILGVLAHYAGLDTTVLAISFMAVILGFASFTMPRFVVRADLLTNSINRR